jgi:hypothetical protein
VKISHKSELRLRFCDFKWESIDRISKSEEEKQKQAKQVFIFVRKVKEENGITLPFTYVGTGKLMNPRKGATANGSILYDIHMNQELPDYLIDDFKWNSVRIKAVCRKFRHTAYTSILC